MGNDSIKHVFESKFRWEDNQDWENLTDEEREEFLAWVALQQDIDPSDPILVDEASLGLDANTDPDVYEQLVDGGLHDFALDHSAEIRKRMKDPKLVQGVKDHYEQMIAGDKAARGEKDDIEDL